MIRNNNKFPRDDSSGKSISKQNVPKTPAEFDYDLWTMADGKCMVRVKRTGEVSEVERDVFRLLRAEEKRMRREKKGIPIPRQKNEYTSMLSLNFITHTGGETEWLEDRNRMEDDVILSILKDDFVKLLTPNQAEIYQKCVLDGLPYTKYAEQKGVSYQSVQHVVERIREKARKFFCRGL